MGDMVAYETVAHLIAGLKRPERRPRPVSEKEAPFRVVCMLREYRFVKYMKC